MANGNGMNPYANQMGGMRQMGGGPILAPRPGSSWARCVALDGWIWWGASLKVDGAVYGWGNAFENLALFSAERTMEKPELEDDCLKVFQTSVRCSQNHY